MAQLPLTDAHRKTFVRSALHAAVWFAHRAGLALADIEREFAEIVADVKAEATAELAHLREADADGA